MRRAPGGLDLGGRSLYSMIMLQYRVQAHKHTRTHLPPDTRTPGMTLQACASLLGLLFSRASHARRGAREALKGIDSTFMGVLRLSGHLSIRPGHGERNRPGLQLNSWLGD